MTVGENEKMAHRDAIYERDAGFAWNRLANQSREGSYRTDEQSEKLPE